MKVIDYLVKVANKEADNITIKTNEYFDKFIGSCTYQDLEDGLNSEVEIIEEKKKIPEYIDNSYYHLGQDQQNQLFKNTINEIIDYLKSKGE